MGPARLEQAKLNGIDTAYRLDGDGARSRPWLVFAHALGHDHSMWEAQVGGFDRACNILRYDLRGHGRSGAPAGDYTLEQLADDLRALLDHLDIERCHMVGLSLGAMVGMQAAIRYPQRVACLAVAGAMSRFSPQALPHWAQQLHGLRSPLGMDAIVDPTLSSWFTAAFFATRSADVARAARVLRATPVNGFLGAMAAMSKSDLTTRLSSLGCPLLVLHSAGDRVATSASAERVLLQVPHARLKQIHGAAHLSNIEQPGDFSDALRDFLAAGP
jgi:3-oxoadipate enol-lactonase